MVESGELRRLMDIEEIRDLNTRYNISFDTRDVENYLACWTQDGYVERLNSYPRATGHDELATLCRDFPLDVRHCSTDYLIRVDGDTATMEHYCIVLATETRDISMMGSYRDQLVRTSEGWKFKVRIFEPYTLRDSESDIPFGKN